MQLNDLTKYLADRFTLEESCYGLDEHTVCYTFDFVSDVSIGLGAEQKSCNIQWNGILLDGGEKENQRFRYAVFAPRQKGKFSEAIILLHGLNERNWKKYLPWAYQLVLQTQKPVILFPIAYHMNRSPRTWVSSRLMEQCSASRRATIPSVENSSFANVALSLRLDQYPELFATSGIQTYLDIVALSSAIKAGTLAIFNRGCCIHFFAYSIGALLTETLLMSNPLQLFSDSRAFFFCGGSTFDKINGCSRSIMDSQAFARLKNHTFCIPEHHTPLLQEGWMAFLAMSGIKKFGKYRENAFKFLVNRIKAIGLLDDNVVPGLAIKNTFSKRRNHTFFDVDVMDFPFKYTHEVPFPAHDKRFLDKVTQSFLLVFNRASLFLSYR